MDKAQVLNDLLQLQKYKNRVCEIDEEITVNQQSIDKLEAGAQNVSYTELPTDYEQAKKSELKRKIEQEKENKYRKIVISIMCLFGLCFLAILGVLLFVSPDSGLGLEGGGAITEFGNSVYIMLAIYTAICILLGKPEGIISWIADKGCLIAVIIWSIFGEFIFGLLAIISMIAASHVTFAGVLPTVMLVLAIVARVLASKKDNNSSQRDYTFAERAEISQAVKLDEENKRLNAKARRQAVEEYLENIQSRKNVFNKKIDDLKSEKRSLLSKIQSNPYLIGNDINDIDQVIKKMSTNRADSVKEALQILDQENARAKSEWLRNQFQQDWINEQRKKLGEMQSDLLWEQAKTNQHRKNVENELGKVKDELEKIRRGY